MFNCLYSFKAVQIWIGKTLSNSKIANFATNHRTKDRLGLGLGPGLDSNLYVPLVDVYEHNGNYKCGEIFFSTAKVRRN